MREVNLVDQPLFGTSLIEASAGTGKTFTIAHLYLRYLLETDYGVKEILIVTFTNAATQELKGRVRNLIYELWEYLKNPQTKHETFDFLFTRYKGDQVAIQKLQQALMFFDEAAIYSIHGFCQRILSSFPVETRSLLQQQVLNNELELQQQGIIDYWRKFIIVSDIKKLHWINSLWKNPYQLLDEIQPLLGLNDHFLMQVAVTGNENTDEKITDTWRQIQQQWRISADKIKEVLVDNPNLNKSRVRTTTATLLLANFEELIAGELPFRIPDKWELLTARKLTTCLKKGMKEERLTWPIFSLTAEFNDLHRAWIKQQKIGLMKQAVEYVDHSLQQSKSRSGTFSFDDLIHRVSTVINPQNKLLINKINAQFPIAMVDEFQDTDSQQYHIFKTLYHNREGLGLIMIGDPKQAIYSFRGADVFTYQRARSSTEQQYTLETNYRSSAVYIQMINRLFNYQPNAFIFQQLIDFYPSKASAENSMQLSEDGKTVAPLVCWMHPWQDTPLGKSQAELYFANRCAEEIEELICNRNLELDNKQVEARDLAILVRTGRQAGLMKNALAKRGIAAAMIQRDSVFASEQAIDISQLLAALINPGDNRLVFGVLSTALFGWNSQQIYELQENNDKLVTLLEQMQAYREHWQQQGILSMFFQLIDEQQTLQQNIHLPDGERCLTNWIHVVELLQQQSNQHASDSQLLRWLNTQIENSSNMMETEEHQLRLESDSELVRIVTVHKSKGLQYPVVFLPFIWHMRNAYTPGTYSIHDEQGYKQFLIEDDSQIQRWQQENLAEDIRLLYVAMTRARYRCYLAWGNIKDANRSAMAHLLYQDDIQINTETDFCQPFEEIAAQNPLLLEVRKGKNIAGISPRAKKAFIPEKTGSIKTSVQPFTRFLQQQWSISSYSQIASSSTHQESIHRPDYDATINTNLDTENHIEETSLNRFTFTKGARAGNLLHNLLEEQSFDKPIDTLLITQKIQEYGFETKWIPVLQDWLSDVLSASLENFSLNEINDRQKICEMEFYMRCNKLNAQQLNRLLHEYNYLLPQQVINFATLNGFLKGFIDLVFEHQGRFYVADYKSNFLGQSFEDYDEESCRNSMFEHYYTLQFLIYTLALHRYLKQRVTDYDYQKHCGGVYYLFLRGMSENNPGTGIYHDKPAVALINEMDRLFD